MKFLVDAQLPQRVTDSICAAGHDAVHTLDLPDGNRTTDDKIIELADSEQRVVVLISLIPTCSEASRQNCC